MTNRLYYGDNLHALREHVADASVDLVYLDPPFNSNANYNILFKSPTGVQADAQIEAFEDTWHWNDRAEDAFDQVARSGNTKAFDLLNAMRSFLGENDMMAYLSMMAIRLIELHRILKPTGSLYLHCDPTASHYLKLLLDGVFGADQFRNELIWRRTSSSLRPGMSDASSPSSSSTANNPKRWGPVHDSILFYSINSGFQWNDTRMPLSQTYLDSKYRHSDDRGTYRLSDLTASGTRSGDSGKPWRGFDPTPIGRHWGVPTAIVASVSDKQNLSSQAKLDLLDEHNFIYWTPGRGGKPGFPQLKRYLTAGQPIQDVIDDIPPINSMAQERLGYPTQKPLALLERIIAASSNEDGVVLDPFCGCGTAVHAAQKLNRQWIGIDITHLAISLIEKRMKAAFPGIAFTVEGTPKDLASAEDLAARDKHQFQWWAVSMVDAMPFGGKKKGADGGVDGIIYFKPDGKKTEKAIVSVKGGDNVGVQMIRDLHSAMEREKAPIGVFITKALPTTPMEREAAAVGRFEDGYGRTVPRLQIITLAEMFQGKTPQIPNIDPSAGFKRAARESTTRQDTLL